MKEKDRLNIGCGERTLEGYINLDVRKYKGMDLVHDLEKTPLPFKNNTFREVTAHHVFEHINNFISLIEEIYRISKPNAIIKIKVPYFKSIGAFKDPTHKRFFTEETFKYFDKANKILPNYNLKCNFKIIRIKYIYFPGFRFLPFKKILNRFLWNIVRSLYIELRVIK